MKNALNLVHVNKTYPNGFVAVIDFNLEIKEKEFIVFVGPSGCGKTTTLRMIAGLEDITSGEIYIGETLVNELLPKDRDIGMVFQSYALYPHMNIYNNLAFGLQLHHIPDDEIKKRVREAAKILGLTNLLERFPRMLSGGQRQRVALGRAIVRQAKVFLMDEPLSNLDAKLRGEMRKEIIKIHQQVGGTTIYVTHDQIEAMSMATRIVIMNHGKVQQIGTPDEVYQLPANKFVAGFIGAPMMNFIVMNYDKGIMANEYFQFSVSADNQKKLSKYQDKKVIVGIRPEHIHLTNAAGHRVQIVALETLGYETIIHTLVAGKMKIVLKAATNIDLKTAEVEIKFDENKFHYFDLESEERI